MRADINLSVRPAGSKELGTRTEMKNMNSLKAIYRAVEFEGKRQIEAIERGEEITQQTRRWDENKDASFPMRDKENAQDYRYFPDPDLMALKISEDWINRIKNTMPESAAKKRERFINDFMLTAYDANVLTSEKPLCELFEKVNELCENPREAANLINVEVIRLMKEFAVSAEEAVKKLKPEHLAALIKKIAEGSINRTVGKDVLKEIFIEGVSPDEYIKHKNLSVIEDASIIDIAVRLVITENEKSVADYISGKEKAFSYLVGQAMKQLKGRANPALVNTALRERLNEL